MKNCSILSELKTQCPPLLREYTTSDPDVEKTVSCKNIGHIRADYNDGLWRDALRLHDLELITLQVFEEFKVVCRRLTADDAFREPAELRKFCRRHPEAEAGNCHGEYNFYYEGRSCTYWLHCIPKERDCILYLHAYAREAPHE